MFAKVIGLMPDLFLKAIYYIALSEMVKRKHLMIMMADSTPNGDKN